MTDVSLIFRLAQIELGIHEQRALKLARDLGCGRAVEDQLTRPLPGLAQFAMLRQASHVVTRIVDGREYSTIGRAEWAALMAWQDM